MTLFEEKKLLRQEIMRKINALTPSYMKSSSEEICRKVIRSEEYRRANTIFVFVGRSWEIDTSPIIRDAFDSHKVVSVPKCIAKGIMEARQITSLDQLEETRLGLLEPGDESCLIPADEIDFTLVPCLTCDLLGRRLGFGGGFYDRYMKNSSFFKCMICREKLISKEVPVAPYDVRPDALITEKRVLIF